MKLLLNTRAFLWWLAGSAALAPAAHEAVADEANGIFVSTASAWEIPTGQRIGKLPGVPAIVADFGAAVADQGLPSYPSRCVTVRSPAP